MVQPEAADQLLEYVRLAGQLLAGGGGLLGGGGVGLNHAGNLVHGDGNLRNGGGLLLGGVGDQVDRVQHLLGACHHFLKGLTGLLGQVQALLHGGYGVLDQGGGTLGGLGGLAGQVAHLVSHHSEALTGSARTGGLDGGVQGQDVGLERDILDGLDDLADFVGVRLDLVHGVHEGLHVRGAYVDLLVGLVILPLGGPGVGGGGLHLLAHVLDGGGQLLDGGGLLRCALGQSLGTVGHLLAAGIDLLGRNLNLAQGIAHGGLHVPHGPQDVGVVANIGLAMLGFHSEIALGQLLHAVVDIAD